MKRGKRERRDAGYAAWWKHAGCVAAAEKVVGGAWLIGVSEKRVERLLEAAGIERASVVIRRIRITTSSAPKSRTKRARRGK